WLDGGASTTGSAACSGIWLDGSRAEGDLGGGSYGNTLERLVIEDCNPGLKLWSRADPLHTAPHLCAANRIRDSAIRPRKFRAGETTFVGIDCLNITNNTFRDLDIEQLHIGIRFDGGCVDNLLAGVYNQHACPQGDAREIVFVDEESSCYLIAGQVGNPSTY